MTPVEAASLDQTRRVLEMTPASLRIETRAQSWSHQRAPTAWCKGCRAGIGRTQPNKSGYCGRSACRKARTAV